jgi:hypothetical protein
MNANSKNNERKEKVSPIIIVREYKNKKGIENRGYSDKIKAIFNGMDKEIMNINLRKIGGLFSGIIQERFKKLDLRCKKSELSFLISSKIRNFSGTNLEAEKENGSFSKLIMNKFKKAHKGGK